MKKRNTMKRRIAITAFVFIAPVIIYNIIFRISPIFISLYLSLTEYSGFKSPTFIGFSNYLRIFSDTDFWGAVLRTLQFSLEVVPLNIILSLLMAILVNKTIRGIKVFRAIYYLPVITPMVAASMIWLWLYDPQIGAFNSILNFFNLPTTYFLQDTSTALHSIAGMRIWRGVGWNMLIYLAGLQGISQNYYEAASIDGAGKTRCFFSITLPLLRPVHLYVLVVGMIQTLQTFTEVYVMTNGGPLESTTTVGLLVYRLAFDYMDMGYASAMSFILGIIIMLLSIISFTWRHTKEAVV
ncbi:MAG TPA: sugar ABC transporter permease [Thermotogota bacterium]|nr:sugar ABC transporter permease [Thermotogota bacterium]